MISRVQLWGGLGGRHMHDSVLVANEMVDDSRRGNKASLILEVDFEKAFDCVC